MHDSHSRVSSVICFLQRTVTHEIASDRGGTFLCLEDWRDAHDSAGPACCLAK